MENKSIEYNNREANIAHFMSTIKKYYISSIGTSGKSLGQ